MAKKIEVLLTLNDRDFVRGIRSAQRSLQSLSGTASRTTTVVGGLAGTKGFGALGPAIAGIGAGLASSSKGLSVVQSSMTKISGVSQTFKDAFKQAFESKDGMFASLKKQAPETTEAISKMKDEMSNLEKGSNSTNNSIQKTGGGFLKFVGIAALVTAAVGGIAIAFGQIRKSIGVSAEFEQIEITLSNLTGSAEKGARALEVITDKAQELPFAFDELAGASPVLLTVSKNLQEFQDNIQLAADIAANFKIPFEQAASSLQRAFSAGAASADVFREKGVLSAAGFEAGVSYSVDETIKKFREFSIKIDGVSEKLNKSLTGATSQAGDALTLFQRELGDAIKPELTAFLLTITALARENKKDLDALASSIGGAVVNSFVALGRALAITVDVFNFLFTPVRVLNNALNVMGTNLPIVATAIYLVVKAQKAFTAATLAAVNAYIFFQGVTGVGLLKVGAGIAAAAATTAALTLAFNKAGESIENAGLDGDPDSALGKFNALLVDIKDTVGELPPTVDAAGGDLKDLLSDIANIGKTAGDSAKDTRTAFQKLRDEIDLSKGQSSVEFEAFMLRLNNLFETGAIGIQDYINTKRQLDEVFGQNEGLNNFIESLSQAQIALSEDLATAFLEGQSAAESFKNFFKNIITQIIADIIRLQIIQPILGALLAPFGFGFGTGGSIIPGFHNGGSLMPNKPAIVGEKGPELFIPAGAGTIVANSHLQGGGGGRPNITINAVDTQSFQQALARDPEFIYTLTRVGAKRTPA